MDAGFGSAGGIRVGWGGVALAAEIGSPTLHSSLNIKSNDSVNDWMEEIMTGVLAAQVDSPTLQSSLNIKNNDWINDWIEEIMTGAFRVVRTWLQWRPGKLLLELFSQGTTENTCVLPTKTWTRLHCTVKICELYRNGRMCIPRRHHLRARLPWGIVLGTKEDLYERVRYGPVSLQGLMLAAKLMMVELS